MAGHPQLEDGILARVQVKHRCDAPDRPVHPVLLEISGRRELQVYSGLLDFLSLLLPFHSMSSSTEFYRIKHATADGPLPCLMCLEHSTEEKHGEMSARLMDTSVNCILLLECIGLLHPTGANDVLSFTLL